MMNTRRVTLSINGESVQIVEFVKKLMGDVISGMLVNLKGADISQEICIFIDGDVISITTGGNIIETNPFIGDIIRKTTIGMASSLKRVGKIEKLEINIT